MHLGAGAKVKPVVNSGFYEIDSLASEFVHMADQVVSYRARLQRHLRAITHSQDEERRRVSRELHDETIQNMLAIDRQLELFLSEGDQDEEAVRIHRIHDMVQETIQGVRQIVRNLRPLMLEDLGLIPAIDSLLSLVHEEEPGLSTHLRISGDKVSLNPEMELAIYRIIQEALANCRKHAWASSVEVAINYQVDEVQLMISDDGRGFDPPISVAEFADQGHFGLMGIHERVNALGGQFQIESRLNHGVRLITHFPLHRSEFGIEIEGELKEILG